MLLQKWNFKTHKYEPFESPAIFTTLFSDDMDMKIDCANCGKSIIFGESFTSRTIHNSYGLGYSVCEICYEKERSEEMGSITK